MRSYSHHEEILSSPLSAQGIKLDVELTHRCNINCVHCCVNSPVDDRQARERELSKDEIIGILKQALLLDCIGVKFTGGEPLVREDFAELYIAARKLGLRVMLFTNATLITPEIADLLALIPPLELVEVTVYGMTRRSYEAASRVPGSFEDAWRGIRLLQERNIPFMPKGILLPPNMEEVDQFEAWAAGIPWVRGIPSHVKYFSLRCSRDDETRNEMIRRLRLSPDQAVADVARHRNVYLKDWQRLLASYASSDSDKVFHCGTAGCVDPYGYLHPCAALRNPDMAYDLRNGSLEEGLEFVIGLKDLRTTNPDYLARCGRCFLRAICEQCPSKSWAEHGTVDTPVDYSCRITHAVGRYLGVLRDGEKSWEITDTKARLAAFVEQDPIVADSA